jgi:hypothetical protein
LPFSRYLMPFSRNFSLFLRNFSETAHRERVGNPLAANVVGHGIWAGSFYVIAGSLGIAAAYKRTTSL